MYKRLRKRFENEIFLEMEILIVHAADNICATFSIYSVEIFTHESREIRKKCTTDFSLVLKCYETRNIS